MFKRPRAPKTPSIAQAKKLAWLFQSDQYLTEAISYTAPTDAALIKHGWVSASGEGIHPSGAPFTKYTINDDGLYALERYLWARRISTPSPAQCGGAAE